MDPWIVGLAVAAALFPSWSRMSYNEIKHHYEPIDSRIPMAPPSWFYSIVWTLLYIAISGSVMRLVTATPLANHGNNTIYITTWIFILVNFLANKSWDRVFWDMNRTDVAAGIAGVIFVTSAVVLGLLCTAELRDGWAIGLWVPYVVWSLYAFILNCWIASLSLKRTPFVASRIKNINV